MLNFYFSPHDDTLEALVKDGYYRIYQNGDVFCISGFRNKQCFDLENCTSIYEALEIANKHYGT